MELSPAAMGESRGAAMSEVDRRLALAAECAGACRRDGTEVIILSGSAGMGVADSGSDIDLYVICDSAAASVPDAGSLSRLGLRPLTALPTRRGGWLQRHRCEDILIDIEGVPRSAVSATLDAVLVANEVDPEKQKVIRGLLDAVALAGTDEWQLWCRRLAAYPDQLGINMLRRHVRFEPLLRLKRRTLDRDDPLAFYSRLVVVMVNVLGTLAGLNRYYVGAAPGILKWTDFHLQRMQNVPSGTAQRLKAALRDPSDPNLADVEGLILETLDRVDAACPAVSTQRARAALLYR